MKSYSIISVQFGLYYFCCTYSKFSITRKFKMWYINHFELTNFPPPGFPVDFTIYPWKFQKLSTFCISSNFGVPSEISSWYSFNRRVTEFFWKSPIFLVFLLCSLLFVLLFSCVCVFVYWLSQSSLTPRRVLLARVIDCSGRFVSRLSPSLTSTF